MPWLFRVVFLDVLTDSRVAFFTLAMGLMCFIYLICSLRTNICFVIIFLTLVLAFATLTGAYFQISNGNGALANRLIITAGACAFVTCCSGWWIFFAILLASLDFPFQLPGKFCSRLCDSLRVFLLTNLQLVTSPQQSRASPNETWCEMVVYGSPRRSKPRKTNSGR